MQRILTICLLFCATLSLSAQNTRFIDEIFEVGTPILDSTYSTNISVLTGAPVALDLKMDIYQPEGDGADETLRPIVCLFHTGNFLPQYVNRGAYGSRTDSANVEMIERLVKRGFVAASVSYRQGWLPTALDQDQRTGGLLQAAYRGGQDAHAMARYLRMTVAELDNPFMIDTSRIVFMGVGTGGYVVSTHAFLDRNEEIGLNPQFYDQLGDTLIQADTLGNPQGTQPAVLNIPNNVAYSSDVAMTINVGGATGDPIWIEDQDNEPLYISIHSFTDPFAPFYEGLVGVPVGGGNSLPVIDGARGGNGTLEIINDDNGGQPELDPANALMLPAIFDPISTVLNQTNAFYKTQTVMSQIPNDVDDPFQLSRDNLYAFVYPRLIGAPYNWFDEATMRATVDFLNANLNLGLDADVIIAGEELTNPNWNNSDQARMVIDSMMGFMIPRMWYGLDLDVLVSTEDVLDAAAIGLEIYPNPVSEFLTVNVAEGNAIREIAMIDMLGRTVGVWNGIDQSSFRIDRGNWTKGYYNVRIRLDEGIVSKKVLIQ